jgi:hypothetical protein
MLSHVRRLVGTIMVLERGGVITVSGLPTNSLMRDIQKLWSTTRITKHMFLTVDRSELSFYSFFALDVEYILQQLIDDGLGYTSIVVLEALVAELHTHTWLANISKSQIPHLDYSKLSEIRFTLLDHQTGFLNYYQQVKGQYGLCGTLLTAAAGGGKTVSGISIAVTACADVVIIVAPMNSVNDVWAKTLSKDMAVPQTIWVAQHRNPVPEGCRWFIYHYEALDQAIVHAHTLTHQRVVVILDESHNFNDIKSLRTQQFLELCTLSNPTDVVLASGTPIKAMGAEAIPLIRTVDPLFTPEVEVQFRKIWGANAERAYDILSNRLGIISYRVPKGRFMKDKPVELTLKVSWQGCEKYTLENLGRLMREYIVERTAYYQQHRRAYEDFYERCMAIHAVKCTHPAQQQALRQYRTYVATMQSGFDARTMGDMATWCNTYEKTQILPNLPPALRSQFKDTKSVIKYVALKIRGECLGLILSKERAMCHVDMVQYLDLASIIDNSEKKTLIFTSYVSVVDEVYQRLTKQQYAPVRIYGDTNSQLSTILHGLEKDPDCNPAIATYHSLSTAVPCLWANTLVMLNSPFRAHEREQAIARAWRIGQDTTVYVISVVLDTGEEPNISTRSGDILEWSRSQVNQIMGVDADPAADEAAIALEDYYTESSWERTRREYTTELATRHASLRW